MTIRFWIPSSVSEIFAAELRSRPKSGQILHVFRSWNFFGVRPPKILDRHYKIGPITDHRAKFHAGWPTHLGDLARKEKKNICSKTKVLPKTIVFGRTNNFHKNNVLLTTSPLYNKPPHIQCPFDNSDVTVILTFSSVIRMKHKLGSGYTMKLTFLDYQTQTKLRNTVA